MRDRDVPFDRRKHLLYSKAARKVIQAHLARWGGPQTAEALWERVQRTYAGFLSDLPYLGGRKNFQAGSVYDCIALFAFYEALEEKPTLEELSEMNNELFLPSMKRTWSVGNLNRPWMLRAAHGIFSHIAQKAAAHQQDWPGNYHMEVEPFDKNVGIRYRFRSCPIADFARAHGYTHLMPAFCNPDFPMMETLHGALIRTTTCANGDFCDYWIVGDQSPHLKDHPLSVDEEGYLRNR